MSDRHDRHESLCDFDVFKFLFFVFCFLVLYCFFVLWTEDRTDDSKEDKESKIQVVGYDRGHWFLPCRSVVDFSGECRRGCPGEDTGDDDDACTRRVSE
jgi:hypothetical protein